MTFLSLCQIFSLTVCLQSAVHLTPGLDGDYQRRIEPPEGVNVKVHGTSVVMIQGRANLGQDKADEAGVFTLKRRNTQPFDLVLVPHFPFLPMHVPRISGADNVPIALTFELRDRYFGTRAVGRGYLRDMQTHFEGVRRHVPDTPEFQSIRTNLDNLEKQHVDQFRSLTLLIPAFFYPTPQSKPWQQVMSVARTLGRQHVVVIVNINSGDAINDANYQALITQLNKSKIQWVGYLHLSDNHQNLIRHFDQWMNLYGHGMAGIFLANFPPGFRDQPDVQASLLQLCQHVRSRIKGTPLLIADPGNHEAETLASGQLFNWLCLTDQPYSAIGNFRPDWWKSDSQVELGAFIHQMDDSQIEGCLDRLVSEGGSFVNCSDLSDNSWSELPSPTFMKKLVASVNDWNRLLETHKKRVESPRK